MVHRANDGIFVGPLGELWEIFADAKAIDGGGDVAVFAPDFCRGFGLGVERSCCDGPPD